MLSYKYMANCFRVTAKHTHEEDVDDGPHAEAAKGEQLERRNAWISQVVPVRTEPAQRQAVLNRMENKLGVM